MTEFRISPTRRPLHGRIRVPADKSISHRAVMLSVLAENDTRIENFLNSQTTQATVGCLRALGAEIEESPPGTLVVHGQGLHGLREPAGVLFCAGSATTMRLLAGVCAGQPFLSILDGATALKRRPMARVVEPLRAMGATILARDGGRLPPLAIRGGRLRGMEHWLQIASAQVKSALLLAGLFADGPTTVREPGSSRDHTERMLQMFGVKVEREAGRIRAVPPTHLQSPMSLRVPGDFSSAAFIVVAALLVSGSEVCIEQVGLNPTRTGLLDVLVEMGARIRIEQAREESGESVADVVVHGEAALHGTEIAGDVAPRMIDEFPVLAVAATQAAGETQVRDAQELRMKETDRIAALVRELRKMGAQIEEHSDGFTIAGPTPLHGARVSAHNDHRLAMSLAVAGLIARGETCIQGWGCVKDSFPRFEETLAQVGELNL